MKKFFKILAVLIAIPVLLFAVAAAVLVTIDLNNYKTEISRLVHDQTGRDLTVNGELGKSFFPWLGVTVGDVALSNAKGFGEQPFVAVKRVEVKIDTLSLLRMQPAIDRVILHGLSLNLAKDQRGKTNWDDLAGGGEAAPAPPAAVEPGKPKSAPSTGKKPAPQMLAALTIGGLDVQDANVSWDDKQANVHYDVKNVNLVVSEVALNKPLSLSLALDFASQQPPLSSHLELQSPRIEWNLDQKRYALQPITIKLSAKGKAIGPTPIALTLSSKITADLVKEQASVDALQLQTMGIALSGKAQANQLMSSPAFKAKLNVASFNPRDLLGKLNIALPPMADKKAFTQVAVQVEANGDLNKLDVPSLHIKLDDTTLQSKASIHNFAKPAIHFNVDIDKVNVDRYLPPPAETEKTPAPAAEAPAKPEQPLPIPVELIRGLNIDGQLTVAQLTVMKLDSTDVQVKVTAKQGHVDLKPVALHIANGKLESQLSLDASKAVPEYAVKQTIQDVNAVPIVKAVAGEDYVSGTLNLTAAINTKGLLISDIKKQLNGTLKFRFTDGAVKGFNLGDTLRKVQAKLKGQDYKSGDAPLSTDFAELAGSATITKGIVVNKDLTAKSPLLRVKGEGKVDLPRNYLNYLATAYVVGTAKGQGGRELDELKGLPIPIRLKGTFDKLDYKIDYGPIREAYKAKFKQKAKQEIEKKKQEVKQDIAEKKQEVKKDVEKKVEKEKKKLENKAKEQLKKLFKF